MASMNPPPELCAGCSKKLPKREFLRCATCALPYDLVCINISKQRYLSYYAINKERKDNWKCPECLSKVPKKGNECTPVRSSLPTSSPQVRSNDDTLADCLDDSNVTRRTRAIRQVVSPASDHENLLDLSEEVTKGSQQCFTTS